MKHNKTNDHESIDLLLFLRNQLSDWLKAKGRTPSKFRHLMCFHDNLGEEEAEPQTKSSLSVEELSEQVTLVLAPSNHVTIKSVCICIDLNLFHSITKS